jgi:hypothetical protein
MPSLKTPQLLMVVLSLCSTSCDAERNVEGAQRSSSMSSTSGIIDSKRQVDRALYYLLLARTDKLYAETELAKAIHLVLQVSCAQFGTRYRDVIAKTGLDILFPIDRMNGARGVGCFYIGYPDGSCFQSKAIAELNSDIGLNNICVTGP